MSIKVEEVPNIPFIKSGDDVGVIIANSILEADDFSLKDKDILCIASKIVSTAENRKVYLTDVEVGDVARSIQEKVPRKDPRVVQLIVDATGDPTGGRVELDANYIAGWLPNGMRLTSAGIDKIDGESVYLPPEDSDKSARRIAHTILEKLGVRVGVVITDSDGRTEKAGSTQVAIGLYGVPGLRITEVEDPMTGKVKRSEETISDLLAATAALIMGQRGVNKPVVCISGLEYDFDEDSSIIDSLSRVPEDYIRPSLED